MCLLQAEWERKLSAASPEQAEALVEYLRMRAAALVEAGGEEGE